MLSWGIMIQGSMNIKTQKRKSAVCIKDLRNSPFDVTKWVHVLMNLNTRKAHCVFDCSVLPLGHSKTHWSRQNASSNWMCKWCIKLSFQRNSREWKLKNIFLASKRINSNCLHSSFWLISKYVLAHTRIIQVRKYTIEILTLF